LQLPYNNRVATAKSAKREGLKNLDTYPKTEARIAITSEK